MFLSSSGKAKERRLAGALQKRDLKCTFFRSLLQRQSKAALAQSLRKGAMIEAYAAAILWQGSIFGKEILEELL